MKNFYPIILGITAVLLAATAAYFSVFGLSKLFIGASLSVIIMAGTLEFAKIITVSFLHQYWHKLAKMLKIYLLMGIFVLMAITSVGIYGFLSSAYSKVSVDMNKIEGNISLIDKKIEIKIQELDRLDAQVKVKNDRIVTLTNLRESQENRLDSLYQKGWISSAKKTEIIIAEADKNIKDLNIEITELTSKINDMNDSVSYYETKKLETENNDLSGEVGPLKFISELTGTKMDKVVNWMILLLILVFDPLAMALVVSTSSLLKIIKKEKEDIIEKSTKLVQIEQNNLKEVRMYKSENDNNDALPIENNINDEKEALEELNGIKNEVHETQEISLPEFNDTLCKTNIYSELINILFSDGKKIGDEIPSYSEFKSMIMEKNQNITDKDIKDFLLICNLFKITEFKDGVGYFNKNHEDSFYMVAKI